MYGFQERLVAGSAVEQWLDTYFGQWFRIKLATRWEQRLGIDRWFLERVGSNRWAVEYKADWTASRTGNVFIETISVDTKRIPGWAYTSQAHWLVYALPKTGEIYAVPMAQLRAQLESWSQRYPTRAVPNRGYHTHGLLVPLDMFKRLAESLVPASS
jgi:hypothetical protein